MQPTLTQHRWMQNLPNILTFLRIALIPVMVIFYYLPYHWCQTVAAIVFIIAGFTDWLDGYLARNLQLSSQLGAFLDPVADKLLVAVSLVLLVSDPDLPYLAIPAAIIIGREIAISALREWMAEVGKRASVAVSRLGKLKTMLQMGAITLLLYTHSGHYPWLKSLGYATLYLAAILTLWSMFYYLKASGIFDSVPQRNLNSEN